MNPTIFFSVFSLFYCVFLIITLYSKDEQKSAESKMLKILTFINLGSLICEAAGIFLGGNYQKYKLINDIALRLMLVLYVSWYSVFAMFVHNISKRHEKFKISNNKIFFAVMVVFMALVTFLPIVYNTNKEGVIIYSSGMAVQVVYYYVMFCEVLSLGMMFRHIKEVRISNYTSLFMLIMLSTLSAAIQSYYPSVLLSASTETLVLYAAYINSKKIQLLEKTGINKK